MDLTRPYGRAFEVTDGRFSAIGEEAALRQSSTAEDVVDLGGRAVTPGFIDAHLHFGPLTISQHEIDMAESPPASIAALQELFAVKAASSPAGAWVRGFGYSESALAERRHPTRWELDEAVPDRPAVAIHWSYHRLVANSRALELAGIRKGDTEIAGGIVHCDESGEPTGLLTEAGANSVIGAMVQAMLDANADSLLDWVELAAQRCLAAGITAVNDAWTPPAFFHLFRRAAEAGRLRLGYTPLRGHEPGLFGSPAAWLKPGAADDPANLPRHFRRGGVKFFADGVWDGIVFLKSDELNTMVQQAVALGYTAAIHATTNAGSDLGLEAVELARKATGGESARLRLEHVFLPRPEDIKRLRATETTVVTQPSSLWRLRARPPAPGALPRLPVASFQDAGVRVAFSSDYPCFPLEPLRGIDAAVTRRTSGGETVFPEQAVSAEDAIRHYTLDAAWAGGSEDIEGSISPGKLANFVVLSHDPRESHVVQTGRLQVDETWVDGERVYQRGSED